MKFGQNPVSGLGGNVVKRLWTDGQTDDDDDNNDADDDDNGQWVITIAHLEPSAQVSK